MRFAISETGFILFLVLVLTSPLYANSPPVAANLNVQVAEDASVLINLATGASDPDGDPLTFQIIGSPLHGTLGPFTAPTVTYFPLQDF